MSLLRRDTTCFKLYRARYAKSTHGDGCNVYDQPPVGSFRGNIQPFGENAEEKAYGIDLGYAYVIYAQTGIQFRETDRITDGVNWYEIKVVRRWNSYLRLMVEEVTGSAVEDVTPDG